MTNIRYGVLVCCFTKKITRIAPLSYHHPIEYHHHQFHNKITSHHRLMVSGAWLVTIIFASPQAVIFRRGKVLHRFQWKVLHFFFSFFKKCEKRKVLHLFLFTSLPQGPQTSREGISPGIKYKVLRKGMRKYKIMRLRRRKN